MLVEHSKSSLTFLVTLQVRQDHGASSGQRKEEDTMLVTCGLKQQKTHV